ncbi:hypothetical protein LXL04_007197 [Taraxacum kok-saghyz]
MIAIDYHNSCETPQIQIPKRSFQKKKFKQLSVATFEPVKVIKKKKEDKSDSKQLSKSNSKLDVLISRPIREAFSPNIHSKERLLHKGDGLNIHAEKTECYDQQAMQRLSKDKQKAMGMCWINRKHKTKGEILMTPDQVCGRTIHLCARTDGPGQSRQLLEGNQ